MKTAHRYDYLLGLYIFCIAAAELMGGKTFPLANLWGYRLNASVGIFLIPPLFTIIDVVNEVYGKQRARNVVRVGLFVIALIMLFALFAIHLPPSTRFLERQEAYYAVFSMSARIAFASLTAFAVAEFLDVYLFATIRTWSGERALWLRNNVSNIVGQFVDTVIFMFIAFYAFDQGFGENATFLFSLILPYWLLKCTVSFLQTPFVYLGVWWLRGDQRAT
jgi:queuosine precursor transporter